MPDETEQAAIGRAKRMRAPREEPAVHCCQACPGRPQAQPGECAADADQVATMNRVHSGGCARPESVSILIGGTRSELSAAAGLRPVGWPPQFACCY
jgi:hypothetical protein